MPLFPAVPSLGVEVTLWEPLEYGAFWSPSVPTLWLPFLCTEGP